MQVIRPVDYQVLLSVFARENVVKDGWSPDNPDDWPRARFSEANEAAHGQWGEYSLNQADLASIIVQWNTELEIPKTGIMMPEAATLPAVQKWLASEKPSKLTPDSHLWLSANYIRHDSSEEMEPRAGVLYLLDGLHRSIFWFHQHREPVLAFIAGQLPVS